MKRYFTLLLMLCHGLALSQIEQISDIDSGPGFSNPSNFYLLNGDIYMQADDGRTGVEVWKSNGTREGTMLVRDINLGTGHSITSRYIELNEKLYFAARDEIHGSQLWTTNGTASGTEMITQNLGMIVSEFVVMGDFFYFLTGTSSSLKLWKCDGSKNGLVLVKSITASSQFNSSTTMHGITVASGLLFFVVGSADKQTSAVWRSDGMESGTFPVAEDLQGISHMTALESQYATQLIAYDNSLYFIARSSAFGGLVGLVKTDGTVQGTEYITSMFALAGDGLEFWHSIVHGDRMYFSFFDEESNRSFIWESEGNSITTSEVYTYTAANYFSPSVLCSSGDKLFFTSGFYPQGTALIQFSATEGVLVLKQISNTAMRPAFFLRQHDGINIVAASSNTVYLNCIEPGTAKTGLWVSNGTPDGTVKISDSSRGGGMLFNDGYLYYAGADGTEWELWKTNGTPGGTALLKDINFAGKNAAFQSPLVQMGDVAIFSARTQEFGSELWITNASIEGTKQLLDIFPGTIGCEPRNLVSADNGAYFIAQNATYNEWEVFFTDGTIEGTTVVTDFSALEVFASMGSNLFKLRGNKFIVSGTTKPQMPSNSNPYGATILFLLVPGEPIREIKKLYDGSGTIMSLTGAAVVGNTLYFTTDGNTLWKTDGTTEGTIMVKDFYYISSLSGGTDKIYFAARELSTDTGQQLYVSDGTTEGTSPFKTILSPELNLVFHPLADKAVFWIPGPGASRELWITDGTANNTTFVKAVDLFQNNLYDNKHLPVELGENLIFPAINDNGECELWKTDGTADGTVLVKDIHPGPGSSKPLSITKIGDQVYFSAYTPEYGFEVWSTDGTSEHTKLLIDIIPGPSYSNPRSMVVLGDKLVLIARSGESGDQLFAYASESDPTNEPIENPVTAVENRFNGSVAVYPNPSYGILRVADSKLVGSTVAIYDAMGNFLVEQSGLTKDSEISLGQNPAGLYLLKFQKDGAVITAKVIKL